MEGSEGMGWNLCLKKELIPGNGWKEGKGKNGKGWDEFHDL